MQIVSVLWQNFWFELFVRQLVDCSLKNTSFLFVIVKLNNFEPSVL